MTVKLSLFVVFILSVNYVSVCSALLSWIGSNDVSINTNGITELVEDTKDSTVTISTNVIDNIVEDVEEFPIVHIVDDVEEYVEDYATKSTFLSIFEKIREKVEDFRDHVGSFFTSESFEVSNFADRLANLTPQQFYIIQDTLSSWTQEVANYGQNEWELRKEYLMAAKNNLYATSEAFYNGDYDLVVTNIKSAMANLMEESCLYRALRYALYNDTDMIPVISDLGATLLQNLEYDLSAEALSD